MPWAAHHLLKMDLWPDLLNWRSLKFFFFVLQFSSFESLEIERNSVFPSIQALIRETDTLWRTKNAQWVIVTKKCLIFWLAKISSYSSWILPFNFGIWSKNLGLRQFWWFVPTVECEELSQIRERETTYFAYFWICYFDSCHLRFQFMLHWSSSEIWVFEVHQTTVEKSKGNHVCCPTDIYAFYTIYTLFPNKETDK